MCDAKILTVQTVFALAASLVMNVLIFSIWVLADDNSITSEIIWIDYTALSKFLSCKYRQWQQNVKNTWILFITLTLIP